MMIVGMMIVGVLPGLPTGGVLPCLPAINAHVATHVAAHVGHVGRHVGWQGARRRGPRRYRRPRPTVTSSP